MSVFCIEFLPDIYCEPESGEKYQYGTLTIGSFQEKFLSSLSFWSLEDYQLHWNNALERIIYKHYSSSLIVDMFDPSHADVIEWWLMYRDSEKIYFQNSLLLLRDINNNFYIDNLFEFIPERKLYTEEGEKISEWSISVRSIKLFLEQLT